MVNTNYSWIDKENEQSVAKSDADRFFVNLIDGKVYNSNGTRVVYRSGQNEYANAVMNAIKNNEILLIEAGVGIGKSYGYLIPIFCNIKNVQVFNKVIISTSSRTLSDQLVRDVASLSKILGMEIKVEVSKGMNNYACIDNINKVLKNAKDHNDTATIELLEELKRKIKELGSTDIADLGNIPANLWSSIQVSGCTNCKLKDTCEYNRHQEALKEANIIITNHVQLGNIIDTKLDEYNPDMIVVDEAHNLEEQIRLSKDEVFSIKEVYKTLDRIDDLINSRKESEVFYVKGSYKQVKQDAIKALTDFIKSIRNNAIYNYKKENDDNNYLTTQKLTINLESKHIKDCLYILLKSMVPLVKMLKELTFIKGMTKNILYIKKYIDILLDMEKNRLSKNVYWVRFNGGYNIDIVYTPKNISSTLGKLYRNKMPIVMTSGTLMTDKTYDNTKVSLLLEDNKRVIEHDSIPSPYDYENNTLFYYDPEVVSPKNSNKELYYKSVADRVEQLIRITDGKALVLFTSKEDMRAVYNDVSTRGLSQKLILQGDNAKEVKNEFKNDVNSCLFATGAFWEGVDFNGETLSNLIVVRLPFPVMDPIVEYKKEGKSSIEINKLTKDEMLMKLAQGTGRLIRCSTDKGIVCCLDSRFKDYADSIINTLPFVNYTTDINDVIEFSKQKITNQPKDDSKKLILEPIK